MLLKTQQLEIKHPSGKSTLAIFAICVITFVTICLDTVLHKHDAIDKSLIAFLNHHRSGNLTEAMRWITFLGSSLFLLPAYFLLVAFLLIKRQYREAGTVVITSSGGWLIQTGLKLYFHRPRPDHPSILNIPTFSFPSGHAFSSVVFFGIVVFLTHQWVLPSGIKKVLVPFLLFCPIAIGFSRVILNVHYVTDVIAGYALAVMWLIICYFLLYKRNNPVSGKASPME